MSSEENMEKKGEQAVIGTENFLKKCKEADYKCENCEKRKCLFGTKGMEIK
jgi:hypothetical protein